MMEPKEILSELRKIYITKSILVPTQGGIIEEGDLFIVEGMTRKERSLKKNMFYPNTSLLTESPVL